MHKIQAVVPKVGGGCPIKGSAWQINFNFYFTCATICKLQALVFCLTFFCRRSDCVLGQFCDVLKETCEGVDVGKPNYCPVFKLETKNVGTITCITASLAQFEADISEDNCQ